ncbi:AI-2 transport protein TqsA [Pseudoruegeria aquimaris]|uniref:AI-2 transport protein TqsA n=1 Tax=Pseudoruegeria aquimaris TaxID=393663 RepID=A0A1Y5SJG8_9RHOB|nr:AI-2E family transporter [Pseudoruegeria aquimaris]SLN39278.1 AI-2 transport protein TqsA [Pseudoruegeria aquimaris]
MALTVKEQTTYWGLTALAIFAVLWALGDVILPFVIGAAIAYFLDPIADRLEAWGCSRALATALITLLALVGFALMILLIVPTLIEQTVALFNAAPELFADLRAFLVRHFPQILNDNSTISQSLASIGEAVKAHGGEVLSTAVSTAFSLINVIVLLVVAPVVAFYLLLDWDRMIARIDTLLPRDHAPTIRRLAGEIDATLASFLRGQGTVCLLLGIYYAVALMIAGLQFGLVVGVVAGALTFIPYVGALVGGALAIGLALFQWWGDWVHIGIVAAIFASGQMIEGNVLTPKLVGSSVGLHPVWLLFALSAFGALFGFVGMLIAVPVAAALGVLARFIIAEYKNGRLYKGQAGQDSE